MSESRIEFLDIKKQYLSIQNEIFSALNEVCNATAFSGGPFVDKFEKAFAAFCDVQHAVAVNSGTSALHLAMIALGIKAGDEVIVPANTFIATAWGPFYQNAVPVFVDCTADTWNIDVQDVCKKITPRTKAIIGVHLYGQPFDFDAVLNVAREHNLCVIEDCAQAHGAKHYGKTVGSLGEMGCFSFYPGKNLGAFGEGGAITTNNGMYAKRLRAIRNHGSTVRYHHDELGFNMRMDGLQAAVLCVKMKHINAWTQRRQEIALLYRKNINNPQIVMQAQPQWAESAYHLFVITTENRDKLMSYLKMKNIFCGLHYPVPCHLQKVFSHLCYKSGDMPQAEYLASHCLSLPMYSELSDSEVYRVIEAINKYV
ncbi:MAG: DegT/DnrJ/EryC1/StrS family aminotransferase [Patescibacteria group bacterium]